jgi:hypothetical protein
MSLHEEIYITLIQGFLLKLYSLLRIIYIIDYLLNLFSLHYRLQKRSGSSPAKIGNAVMIAPLPSAPLSEVGITFLLDMTVKNEGPMSQQMWHVKEP